MKIAICDDEIQDIYKIEGFLKLYYEDSCHIDMFNSGLDFVNTNEKYDIVFLDIEMGEVNGIDLAKAVRIKDKQVNIIFVTNYADFSRNAFSVHAFDYLIKPFDKHQLFHVLDEIKNYKNTDIQEKEICLKGTEGMFKIKIKEICYFEYKNRKVFVTLDNAQFLIYASLEHIYKQLQDYYFEMPHRAFVVNLKKIKSIQKYNIYIENGDCIPLAQKKAAAFKKNFMEFLYSQL